MSRDGWQNANTQFGDCHISYNIGSGEIVISSNGDMCWDAETLRAFYLELERKGMYDG